MRFSTSTSTACPSPSEEDQPCSQQQHPTPSLHRQLSQSSHISYRDYNSLKKHLNWVFELKNPTLYNEFLEFNCLKRPAGYSYLFLSLALTLFLLPIHIIQLWSDLSADNSYTSNTLYPYRLTTSFILAVNSFLCVFSIWYLTLYHLSSSALSCWTPLHNFFNHQLSTQWAAFFTRFTSMHLIFSSEIYFILIFIQRGMNLNCVTPSNAVIDMFGGGDCFHGETSLQAIQVNSLILITYPLIIFVTMPEAAIKVIWFILTMSMSAIVAISFGSGHVEALPLIILIAIIIIFSILDVQLRNILIFFTTKDLHAAIQEVHEMEEMNRATELRSMIANVAHDLKTPLTSFITGIEYIQFVLKDYQHKVQTSAFGSDVGLVMSSSKELVNTVQSCLTNIRSTNSFMLMTINRCIDYTKASKGMKLVPKLETVDLLEALQLPLNCMQNIQQRIDIKVQEFPKDLCPYMITDRQWLQENVLCLLSNAVKYSSEGQVLIEVSVCSKRAISAASYRNQHKESQGMMSTSESSEQHKKSEEQDPQQEKDEEEDDVSEFVKIEVQDNGIGITDEQMRMLFHPFRQTQRHAGGTGLGLYSLAKRMEALHGHYGVKHHVSSGTELKLGSKFWFAFPYKPDAMSVAFERSVTLEHVMVVEKQSSARYVVPPSISMISSNMTKEETDGRPLDASARLSEDVGKDMVVQVFTTEDSKYYESTPNNTTNNTTNNAIVAAAATATTTTSATDGNIFRRVLIVDDSPAIIKMSSIMLKRLGYDITAADNGQVALQKVVGLWTECRAWYDVILMDLQMPVMDGLEATTRIRAFEQEQCTAAAAVTASLSLTQVGSNLIIGMSANSDNDTAKEALLAGMNAFMGKPFNMKSFSEIVRRARLEIRVND